MFCFNLDSLLTLFSTHNTVIINVCWTSYECMSLLQVSPLCKSHIPPLMPQHNRIHGAVVSFENPGGWVEYSNVMSVICPLIRIGLTYLPKSGRAIAPTVQFRRLWNHFMDVVMPSFQSFSYILYLQCVPSPRFAIGLKNSYVFIFFKISNMFTGSTKNSEMTCSVWNIKDTFRNAFYVRNSITF